MIETWMIIFLIVYIRNKHIQNLERNNCFIYKQYDMRLIFKNWSIVMPLLMLLFYIVFEILVLNQCYILLPYCKLIKSITLFSYFGLVYEYDLCNSIYQKYRDKGLISFITSPFILSILCLYIGYLTNYIAIQANFGHMPLFNDLSFWSDYTDIHNFTEDSFYILGDHNSKYIPFCDIIDLGYTTLSIGDVCVRLFPFIILLFSIKKSNEI